MAGHCTVRAVIAAVVVTHSAPASVLERCLAAIRGAGGVDRIVVVANGGPVDVGGEDLELVRVDNRGYGAAANAGFRVALARGATAVALLNDDVTVRAGWLPPLLAAVAAEGVGAAQPKLLITGSHPPRVNSLGVSIGRDGAGTDIGDGTLDVVVGGPSEIARFTGGAVLFTADFLRATGGFDERYFLYYEDVDLGARGAELGWSYRLVPASVVDHSRGLSTAGDPARTRYLQERNRLWHAFRHADAATTTRAVWLSVRRLRHRPRGVHAKALLIGLAGAPGACWRRARRRSSVGALT
jgi:GT2 family glycosyltransferase